MKIHGILRHINSLYMLSHFILFSSCSNMCFTYFLFILFHSNSSMFFDLNVLSGGKACLSISSWSIWSFVGER